MLPAHEGKAHIQSRGDASPDKSGQKLTLRCHWCLLFHTLKQKAEGKDTGFVSSGKVIEQVEAGLRVSTGTPSYPPARHRAKEKSQAIRRSHKYRQRFRLRACGHGTSVQVQAFVAASSQPLRCVYSPTLRNFKPGLQSSYHASCPLLSLFYLSSESCVPFGAKVM